jgi:glycosyltransferase involved in cell wall biosynthesis
MRVLYDISSLGLAHLYQQSRGGAFRVDLHLGEGLAASNECELLFCANHSAVAYRGCEEFLRENPRLAPVPLVGAESSGRRLRAARAAAGAAHRGVRRLFGSNVLPSGIRHLGRLVDGQLHPRVTGTGSGIDILHSSPLAPLPAVGNRRRPRRFLTLYDLAFIRFTTLYGKAYRDALLNGIRSLQPNDHIITTSHFVRDEIAEAGIASPGRIHVVPLAADPAIFYRCGDRERIAAVRRKYGVPEGPYVLGVNTPDVRKNVPQAIHAFARACRLEHGALASLVLTGHHGSGSDRVQAAIAAHPELRGRIILTGYVPDDDLAPLYTGAQVFVYNSLYEGFGLPPLEAMQCGTPVVTSNTSSLPEVVGGGGVMVHPEDLDGLAGAILDLATESESRTRIQQQALAQAEGFTWDRSVAATLSAYRTALRD